MLVTNRGIVIIMTNPQKTVFLINKSCIYSKKISPLRGSSHPDHWDNSPYIVCWLIKPGISVYIDLPVHIPVPLGQRNNGRATHEESPSSQKKCQCPRSYDSFF